MRVPRSTLTALLASTTAVTAFTTAPVFVSRTSLASSSRRSPSSPSSSLPRTMATSSSSRSMIFGKLFGGGGGSYDTKIDYTALDFPANELGQAAQDNQVLVTSPKYPNLQLATFAGGCFWGLELAYQRVVGVEYTAVGYAQGTEQYPTYSQVCSGATGHTEAVMVYYDPKQCSYEQLLDTFFDRVNPTTVNGQGNDFGRQYRTGVYFHTEEQEKMARKRFELEQTKCKKPIASQLEAAMPFWSAEKYHQQYLEKGGRFNSPQSAEKGATDTIRCYG